MAKKMKKGGMTCPGCGMVNCKCSGSNWCWTLCGLLVLVLGVLIIYPVGWFSFERTIGLLVVLLGLKGLWLGLKK